MKQFVWVAAGITQDALFADIPRLTKLLSYHILPVVRCTSDLMQAQFKVV